MLHLTGYNVAIKDLQSFRQIGSITPGHPEVGITEGVEVSTGRAPRTASVASVRSSHSHRCHRFIAAVALSVAENVDFVFNWLEKGQPLLSTTHCTGDCLPPQL